MQKNGKKLQIDIEIESPREQMTCVGVKNGLLHDYDKDKVSVINTYKFD